MYDATFLFNKQLTHERDGSGSEYGDHHHLELSSNMSELKCTRNDYFGLTVAARHYS